MGCTVKYSLSYGWRLYLTINTKLSNNMEIIPFLTMHMREENGLLILEEKFQLP